MRWGTTIMIPPQRDHPPTILCPGSKDVALVLRFDLLCLAIWREPLALATLPLSQPSCWCCHRQRTELRLTAASISDPQGARMLFARLGGQCKKLRIARLVKEVFGIIIGSTSLICPRSSTVAPISSKQAPSRYRPNAIAVCVWCLPERLICNRSSSGRLDSARAAKSPTLTSSCATLVRQLPTLTLKPHQAGWAHPPGRATPAAPLRRPTPGRCSHAGGAAGHLPGSPRSSLAQRRAGDRQMAAAD